MVDDGLTSLAVRKKKKSQYSLWIFGLLSFWMYKWCCVFVVLWVPLAPPSLWLHRCRAVPPDSAPCVLDDSSRKLVFTDALWSMASWWVEFWSQALYLHSSFTKCMTIKRSFHFGCFLFPLCHCFPSSMFYFGWSFPDVCPQLMSKKNNKHSQDSD